MPDSASSFNPTEHLMKVKGGADYLEVKWRLVWLREQHPGASIKTTMLEHDFDSGYAVFHAEISLPDGAVGSGHGSETRADFADYLEKGETKSIGRALASLGFGTQFVNDFDLEAAPGGTGRQRLADAPVRRRGAPVTGGSGPACEVCGNELRDLAPRDGKPGMSAQQYADWTKKKHGKTLCPACRPRTMGPA